MPTKQLLLLCDFMEDYRTSMAIYASSFSVALQNYAAGRIVVNQFIPQMPHWLQSQWGMRFARYIIYPLQAPKTLDSIIHIMDHGYAHLAYMGHPNRTVVTVHDLIPLLLWKGQIPGSLKKRIPFLVLYSLYALRSVKYIVAISSNTKKDLVKWLGIKPSKISIIYLGVDAIFKPYNRQAKAFVREKMFGAETKKIILITGSQYYKNHETALKTVTQLRAAGRQDLILAKTGQPTPEWLELVKKYGLESVVVNLGFMPRAEMPDLYNAVDVLFFPSLYEGAGLPPLEAMACGTPAVTSNAASLPEMMGEIDLMCDPLDSLGFAQKIEHLLADVSYYQQKVEEGCLQAAKFTWESTARQMFAVYQQLLDEI